MFSIVLLQAMKEDPAPDAKCKDKFLVQAVPVSRGLEDASVGQIVCPECGMANMKINN